MAAGDISVTVIGNLTNDPELRFTPSGAAVASFTVATNSRYLDKATNEWKDGALDLQAPALPEAADVPYPRVGRTRRGLHSPAATTP